MKLALLIWCIGLLVEPCMTQFRPWPFLPNETYHCPACGHSVVQADGVSGIEEIIERDHHPNFNCAENKAPLDALCHLACASVFYHVELFVSQTNPDAKIVVESVIRRCPDDDYNHTGCMPISPSSTRSDPALSNLTITRNNTYAMWCNTATPKRFNMTINEGDVTKGPENHSSRNSANMCVFALIFVTFIRAYTSV